MSTGAVYKTATEEIFSVVAATADADLQFPLLAGKTYLIRGTIGVRAGAAADFRFGFGVGGATVAYAAGHIKTESPMIPNADPFTQGQGEHGVITAGMLAAGSNIGIAGTGNSTTYVNYWTVIAIHLLIQVGETGGTFEFLWGQVTSSATEPAVVLEGSAIQYEVLDDAYAVAYVIKPADEERDDPAAALTDDDTLVLPLLAGQPYLIEACFLGWVQTTFGASLRWMPQFTGTANTYHGIRLQSTVAATNSLPENRGEEYGEYSPSQLGTYISGVELSNSSGSSASSLRGAVYLRGIISVDTAGDFSIQWAKRDNGGADTLPAKMFAGSWMMIRQLNLCQF